VIWSNYGLHWKWTFMQHFSGRFRIDLPDLEVLDKHLHIYLVLYSKTN